MGVMPHTIEHKTNASYGQRFSNTDPFIATKRKRSWNMKEKEPAGDLHAGQQRCKLSCLWYQQPNTSCNETHGSEVGKESTERNEIRNDTGRELWI